MQGCFNIQKPITKTILLIKDKAHDNLRIGAEKAFDKIQHPFMIKKYSMNQK